jgi:putative acyl-CoA dehydrogenase
MARLYREAPLNSVWEGTANMMCMDVRRAMRKDAACREAVLAELRTARGQHRAFDAFVDRLDPLVEAMLEDEYLARPASEALARAIQGAELIRHSTPEVIDAFMSTRLNDGAGHWGTLFGTMGTTVRQAQADAIVDRAQVTPR